MSYSKLVVFTIILLSISLKGYSQEDFELSNTGLSHLMWPFANSSSYNQPYDSYNGVTKSWHLTSEIRDGHDAGDCFAQDWNWFLNGGNADLSRHLYAAMDGEVIHITDIHPDDFNCYLSECNGEYYGNQVIIKSSIGDFAMRYAHMIDINPELYVGLKIPAGFFLGDLGNTGNSSSAHLHVALYKGVTGSVETTLSNGGYLGNKNNAARFVFDATKLACIDEVEVNDRVELFGRGESNYNPNLKVPFKVQGGILFDTRSNTKSIENIKIGNISIPSNRISFTGYDALSNEGEFILDLSGLSSLDIYSGQTVDLTFDINYDGPIEPATGSIYFVNSDQASLGITNRNKRDYISHVVETGIFKGSSSGFDPDGQLTFGQAAKVICNVGLLTNPAFKLNLSKENGVASTVSDCHWAFPYVQTLINNGSITDIADYNPDDLITYEHFAFQLVTTHLKLVKDNANRLANYFTYIVKTSNTSGQKFRDAIGAINTTVAVVEHFRNNSKEVWAEALLINAVANDYFARRNVFFVDGGAKVEREDAAVILSNTYYLLSALHRNKLKANNDPLSQWNIIGAKLDIGDIKESTNTDISTQSKTIQDDSFFDIELPEEDNQGNALVYYYAVKGGTLEPTLDNSFRKVRFTPPKVSSQSTFRLYIWLGNTKGDFAEKFIDIIVNPTNVSDKSPTIQLTDLRITGIQSLQSTIRWSRGNGEKVLVTCTPCGKNVLTPANGTSYSANNNFSFASTIGSSDTKVIYNGSSNLVNLSGLSSGTCYNVAAYEYNGSGSSTMYLTSGAPRELFTTTADLQLDFTWDPLIIVEDQPVDFDWISSLGGLSTEDWTFEGGTPPTDNTNGANIVFANPGLYDVTLLGFHAPSNQTLSITKEIEVLSSDVFTPDFVFSKTSTSLSKALAGQEFEVAWTITNQGVDKGKATFMNYYWSNNDQLDASDFKYSQSTSDYYGSINMSGGNSISDSRELEVPDNAGNGIKYLILELESEESINARPETNKLNNVIVIPIEITPTLPDLTLTNISISKSTFAAGEEITVTLKPENIGSALLPWNLVVDVELIISDDAILDENDVNKYIEGYYSHSAGFGASTTRLNNNEQDLVERSLLTREWLKEGNYFLIFSIDKTVLTGNGLSGEFDELSDSNNYFAIPITIENSDEPSLPATNLLLVEKTNNSVTLNWDKGNGDGAVILALTKQNENWRFPLDGIDYVGNTDWNVAGSYTFADGSVKDDIKCVYEGNQDEVTITNLIPDRTYYFSVFEYNGNGNERNYNTTTGFKTLAVYMDSQTNIYEVNYIDNRTNPFETVIHYVEVDDDVITCFGNNYIMQSIDNGQSFNYIQVELGKDFYDGVTIGESMYALALDGVYSSRDFGVNWIRHEISDDITSTYEMIFLDASLGFVSIKDSNDNGVIYRTSDGGLNWHNTFQDSRRIYGIDEHNGILYASGQNGLFIKSLDLGLTWTELSNNLPSETITHLQVVSNSVIYASTFTSLLKSIDGGISWISVLAFTNQGNIRGNSFLFTSKEVGYALHNSRVIYATQNGGSNWTTLSDHSNLNVAGGYSQGYQISEGISQGREGTIWAFGNNLLNVESCQTTTFYRDNDGDGFGSSNVSLSSCITPTGFSTVDGDCDDNNSLIYPGSTELCDNLDNDCDLSIDEEDCDICVSFTKQFVNIESFEGNFGRWYQEKATDDFDWSIGQNTTLSNNTGPSSAFDGDHYIYLEANDVNTANSEATIYSPCIDLSQVNEPNYLLFAHLFGLNIGSLSVEITNDGGNSWTVLSSTAGNKGDVWGFFRKELLEYTGDIVQFRIIGTAGSGETGDIAIDAFVIWDACPNNDYVVSEDVSTNDDFETNFNLISDAKLDIGDAISFDAGNEIILDRGFEVAESSSLEAYIDGCETASSNKNNKVGGFESSKEGLRKYKWLLRKGRK